MLHLLCQPANLMRKILLLPRSFRLRDMHCVNHRSRILKIVLAQINFLLIRCKNPLLTLQLYPNLSVLIAGLSPISEIALHLQPRNEMAFDQICMSVPMHLMVITTHGSCSKLTPRILTKVLIRSAKLRNHRVSNLRINTKSYPTKELQSRQNLNSSFRTWKKTFHPPHRRSTNVITRRPCLTGPIRVRMLVHQGRNIIIAHQSRVRLTYHKLSLRVPPRLRTVFDALLNRLHPHHFRLHIRNKCILANKNPIACRFPEVFGVNGRLKPIPPN